MNERYETLYEKLLPVVRATGENKELLGGALPSIWSGCQADADYCVSLLGGDSRAKARLFVLADYCTYLPYGAAGYRFLAERIAQEDYTVGQFRASKLQALFGDEQETLSFQDWQDLSVFLNDDGETEPDLNTFVGSLTAVCRIYHACEANFGRAGYKDYMDVAERTSDILVPFLRARAAGEQVFVETALRSAKQEKALTAKQKKILLSLVGVQ